MSKNILNREGITSVASNGMTMKIIAYRGSNDIDVEFEDGVIITSKTYNSFRSGRIKHPTVGYIGRNVKPLKIGQTSVASNGMPMEIIAYRNGSDVDIEFEDGYVVKHKTYQAFLDGNIKHVLRKQIQSKGFERLGQTNTASNGMPMKIIAHRSATDIDIVFEDGTVVTNKTYQAFANGKIIHPIHPFKLFF